MTHDPRRVVSGFVDYVGLARLVLLEPPVVPVTADAAASAVPGSSRAVLRVAIIVTDDDLQLFSPFLKGMTVAVDGVAFAVKAYVAEPAKDKEGHTSLVLSFAAFDIEGMADTTFDVPFESRPANVEMIDASFIGERFVNSRYNGKPSVESMHGTNGGATGTISDMMGYGLLTRPQALKHVPLQELDRWHLGITFEEWSRKPALRERDTIFVNGMAATIVHVYSDSECDVVVPPKLRATTTLVLDATESLAVNVEITGLACALAMAKSFRTKESTDEYFMRLAMNEGDRGRTTSGPSAWTGAVLVDNATRLVLGAASCNTVDGTHSEVACIEQARDAWPSRFVLAAANDEAEEDESGSDSGSADDEGGAEGIETDMAAAGMTLYVTHTPCNHRHASSMQPVTACVPLLAAYRDILVRVVVGVNDSDETGDDLKALALALPDTEIAVLPSGTELSAELRWTLREYTHWRLTKLPYTTALLVKTIDGRPISRSSPVLAKDMAPFMDALRSLAQAVVIDGDTLCRTPTAFGGLVPHQAIQIIARVPKKVKYNKTSRKNKKHTGGTMPMRIVKQPFPLRVLMVTPMITNFNPEVRAKWLPNTEELGAPFVYTTSKCLASDVWANRSLLKEDTLKEFAANPEMSSEALQLFCNTLWSSKPHVKLACAVSEANHSPDPSAVFRELGALGVVTAFVEGDDVFVESLMSKGLVDELIVVTVPVMAVNVTREAIVQPDREKKPSYVLTLIASGELGDQNLSSVHYIVSPVKRALPPADASVEHEKKTDEHKEPGETVNPFEADSQ